MSAPRRYVFTKSGSVVERVPGQPRSRYRGQTLVAVRRVDTGKQMLVLRSALIPLSTWLRQIGAT